ASTWREMLEKTPNVDFYQDMVKGLIIKGERVCGVITGLGHEIMADAVVLTNGTFLNGIIHIGEKNFGGGRAAEKAATGITEQLISIGFESDRLKTGTPPRVDGRSLDYSKMDEQPGDLEITGFSYLDIPKPKKQKSCWITYTNQNVHDILRTGFDRSPMFAGRIDGVGPRYCPSIEDKINRFAERERHQLFIEPEGWNTVEIYVNGFSTSLPEQVQYEALRMVPGFENARIFRPGYAIEYDYFPPTQLNNTLETKCISNLFFAGQINGTTGYEEAACQGLMAGINAHQKTNDLKPVILKRSEAYIGVLIDDLINKGTDEPYRMFTSRAEFRTLLRQDNADLRLTELSYRLGLASQERMDRVIKKKQDVETIKSVLKETSIEPEEANSFFETIGTSAITEKQKAEKILLRPGIDLSAMSAALPTLQRKLEGFAQENIEQASIQVKYDVYIEKEKELVNRMSQLEHLEIPASFEYKKILSLGNEAREKLSRIQPRTLGQASRISGINPSDIQILMVYMGR
ncbi:MAG TPA: tRNA uridine-5-carboxymethylaminomethyl(34) synthesis enzyme MnmG, partial [Chitinophagaceae bacterium]|nr:tRNA uridine-5-carboxymethylaminomethyl(34) synthesis enzyme MnmG [Chitinophagaceae bacterium]